MDAKVIVSDVTCRGAHSSLIKPADRRAAGATLTMSIDEQPTACPNCAFPKAVWLRRMRQHDKFRDWFHCEKCDHFFTMNRLLFDERVTEVPSMITPLTA